MYVCMNVNSTIAYPNTRHFIGKVVHLLLVNFKSDLMMKSTIVNKNECMYVCNVCTVCMYV